MSEFTRKPPCRSRGCTWCLPYPGLPTTGREHPVPGYWGTDPDGHEYFMVSTRWAGTWGENLQFRVIPDDLKDAPHGT